MFQMKAVLIWVLIVLLVVDAAGKHNRDGQSIKQSQVEIDELTGAFPSDFLWGASTAAYQIEGAWNVSKQPSNWDVMTHTCNGCILNNDTGDVADSSYYLWKEDHALLSTYGLTAYRFSISWSRIITENNTVNEDAIHHYSDIIDDLLSRGITPFVTMYHCDIPYAFDNHPSLNNGLIQGWQNKTYLIPKFLFYAETLFTHFGDRVKHWITINEPRYICELYDCGHTAILVHANVVKLYRSMSISKDGIIGMVIDGAFSLPLTNTKADHEAVERALVFDLGWLADPIYFGDYPVIMRQLVPRLPKFTDEEKILLKSTKPDFFGLNHYTTNYASNDTKGVCGDSRVCEQSTDINGTPIGPQGESPWLFVYPPGIRLLLHWVQNRYQSPIYVTENGCDAPGESQLPVPQAMNDQFRVDYYKGYLGNVTQAVQEGVDLRGYFIWSLLDNFEWNSGFQMRFGMTYVDYKGKAGPPLARYPKRSAQFYSDFVAQAKQQSKQQSKSKSKGTKLLKNLKSA